MAAEPQSVFPDRAQSASTQPKASELSLIPFAKVGDEWMLPESVLQMIAHTAHAEGRLQTVFVEGGVSTPHDLVTMFKNPRNLPVFVFKGLECVGFGWLNGAAGNRAFAHFCMLNAARGFTAIHAFRLMLDYWTALNNGGGPIFDTLIGLIPKANERAVEFAERAGCVRVGVIPEMLRNVYTGERADAVILYFSRANHGLRR